MLCSVCQKKTESSCSLCKSVYYCSRDCQKSDWKSHKKCCNSFIVKEEKDGFKSTSPHGISIVAAKDLELGDHILVELPLFHISRVPQTPTRPGQNKPDLPKNEYLLCVTCGTNLSGFLSKRCSGCKWPVCVEFGKNCEKHKIHVENECGILASTKITYDSLAVHEDRRVVLILRAQSVKETNPDLWDELMKRADKIVGSGRDSVINREEISKLEQAMKKLDISNEDIEVYKKLFSLLNLTSVYSNTFEFRVNLAGNQGKQKRVGDFLYPLANYFSHSCAPNCNFAVEDYPNFKIHIRAARSIKKGEELTIHHLLAQLYDGTIERRRNIKDRYGFLCKCKRCSDPTEFGTFFSGIICDNCRPQGKNPSQSEGHLGYFLPLDPEPEQKLEGKEKDSSPLVQCSQCKTTRLYSFFKDQLSAIAGELGENYERFIPGTPTNCRKCEPEQLKKFLSKYRGKILHPNHFLIYRALCNLSTFYSQVLIFQTMGFDEMIKRKNAFEECLHFTKTSVQLENKFLDGALMDREAFSKSYIAPALLNLARIQTLSDRYKNNPLETLEIVEKLKESIQYFNSSLDFYTKYMPTCFKAKYNLEKAKEELGKAEDMLRQFNSKFRVFH